MGSSPSGHTEPALVLCCRNLGLYCQELARWGGSRSQQAEGQNPGGGEQQVTKDASESHPHRLPQKGWYGGHSREREKKGGERRRGGKRREKEKEQEQEKTGVKATLHTQWGGRALLSFARCFFQKEKRSGPHRTAVLLPLRTVTCESPHTLPLSAHGLLAGLESKHSDSQCPPHPPSRQPVCHAEHPTTSPPRTHSLCPAASSLQSPLLPPSPQGAEQWLARMQGWPPLSP